MSLKKISVGTMLLLHNTIYLNILPVLIAASVEDPQDAGEGMTFLIIVFLPLLILNILVNTFLLFGLKKRTAIVTGFMIMAVQSIYFVFLLSLINII